MHMHVHVHSTFSRAHTHAHTSLYFGLSSSSAQPRVIALLKQLPCGLTNVKASAGNGKLAGLLLLLIHNDVQSLELFMCLCFSACLCLCVHVHILYV